MYNVGILPSSVNLLVNKGKMWVKDTDVATDLTETP